MGGTQTANERSALRPAFAGVRATRSLLKIEAWMPSEIKAISPLVNRLMRLIEGSRCVAGNEPAVELSLQEALSNAVIHGNRMDAHKLVQIHCQCELGKGVSIIVTDHGQGFDPKAVPDPLAIERLGAEHGRGLHLMKRRATQEQICAATTKPCTAALWTAFSVALSLRLPRRMRVAEMRGRRAEDHHDGDADRKEMDRAGTLSGAVGQRTQNNLEEGAPQPGQAGLHYRPR